MRHLLPFQLTALLATLWGGAAQAQPTLTGTAPRANSHNVAPTAPITVSFSQALSGNSITALRVFSTQRGGMRSGQSGTTIVGGNQLSFIPPTSWKPGETVRTTVTTDARNTAGQALAKGHVFDFTAATGGNGLGTLTNVGGSSFSMGAYPNALRLADVDGDGDLDVLSSNSNYYGGTPLSVRLNNGAGQFSGGSEIPVASDAQGSRSLTVGDIDNDGDLDVLATDNVYKVSVCLNNGSGVYTVANIMELGTTKLTDLELADIDADGDLDCLMYGAALTSSGC
ncbi:FG-GAP-like repeat-containing protein [Hymenobacter cellulosilyticus]|uniref:FG-GAP-like repeat-containing protein n=1 Tax=Hymenobacter cellulosilyticus TaxID=2932248 RepID=A0A8T9Q6U3_9BACT|nr:FG-GAP-like repeat-containing protein [Hymenobacter cellulosilyticus]UOQ71490.1 FG-GAP-like repeat-containing protein [Hymenobacter cellulosilyticus]